MSLPWPDLHQSLIFVVDDHTDTLAVYLEALEFAGARVATFSDADTAVVAIQRVTPRVVITSLSLRGHDGVWLMEQVRAVSPEIGVIAVTGIDVEVAADAGFAAVLRKPLDPGVLCAEVAKHLGSAGS